MFHEEYFDRYNDCHKHDKRDCASCKRAMKIAETQAKAQDFSTAIVAAPIQSSLDDNARKKEIEMSEVFHKQVDMIQTVLELGNDDVNKIKVKDMPEMMKKVQTEANIGHMKKMLAPRPSFLEKLFFGKGK